MSANVKLGVKAFCVAAACVFLEPREPQAAIATVLLMVAVVW